MSNDGEIFPHINRMVQWIFPLNFMVMHYPPPVAILGRALLKSHLSFFLCRIISFKRNSIK